MDRTAVDRFEAGRARLASLAYRLLGSAADAEDAVQDAYLRWQAADRDLIQVPEAWLTKVVTNLCLDQLRSARVRHERAAGAWLPEPLLDGDPMLGPAATFEQRESVSLAVLTLMERLAPVERAAYVLREAFSYSHGEIAEILDITEAASQQHVHRARHRIAAERRARTEVDPAAARRIVEAFLAAAVSGRTDRLVAMLTADATAVSDGAGLARRLLRMQGPHKIASLVRAGFRPTPAKRQLAGGSPAFHLGRVNGAPAVLAVVAGRVAGVVAFEIRDGRIAALHGIAAAARLTHLDDAWQRHGADAAPLHTW
ncbi:sigma-70 family RNA polymerase sigma factor [Streptomyces sp. TLI_171]|uniref:sigma-70 family RNA polymerase sigma factor n=1 Tax=Streptomyces sp. TLI_171 TaxID=1938859 RepID=UPI000C191D87|nr:sigma-70 family RNA polymerase sigma factor [Streptomyces sp. TLI_171]RKE18100.1 RNA polymerase ECF family sigma subunit [Streptomyces sp. TLI_171]